MKRKYLSVHERSVYRSLEDVIGCKWSAAVEAAIGEGVRRPGRLERLIPGISTKVLNERSRKLTAYGPITRTDYSGLPARVDYTLTPAGKKLAAVIQQLNQLNAPGAQTDYGGQFWKSANEPSGWEEVKAR